MYAYWIANYMSPAMKESDADVVVVFLKDSNYQDYLWGGFSLMDLAGMAAMNGFGCMESEAFLQEDYQASVIHDYDTWRTFHFDHDVATLFFPNGYNRKARSTASTALSRMPLGKKYQQSKTHSEVQHWFLPI